MLTQQLLRASAGQSSDVRVSGGWKKYSIVAGRNVFDAPAG
jgi:hypothetical protein